MSQLQQLAEQASLWQQQYSNGNLSPSEYKELVEDLKIVEHIQSNSNDFEREQLYRSIIMGVIQLASAIY
jgi:hypothetical protein